MTRLWQPAEAITIRLDGQETPAAFIWKTQHYRVNQIVRRWRKREWWRHVWREYYKVIAVWQGKQVLIVIYHDLLEDHWYLQEVYD